MAQNVHAYKLLSFIPLNYVYVLKFNSTRLSKSGNTQKLLPFPPSYNLVHDNWAAIQLTSTSNELDN